MSGVSFYPGFSYEARALEALSEQIFKDFGQHLPESGSRVLFKPNMVKALPRASCGQTDPAFLCALVDRGLDLGWKITVADSPAIGSAEQAAKVSGLWAMLQKRDVPVLSLSGAVEETVEGRRCRIATECVEADAVINVPKLKGHGQLYYTGGIKNLFGCVAGKRKIWHHMHLADREGGRLFAQMLLDHARACHTTLTVMDGIEAMAGRGPIHGEAVFENLVAVSTDPIALDAAVFEHLSGVPAEDPVMSLLLEKQALAQYYHLNLPMGSLGRGAFYFPAREQRKPISFRPWVLARMAWRNLLSS